MTDFEGLFNLAINYDQPFKDRQKAIAQLRGRYNLVKKLQDALGTAEEGDDLVEVAAGAHRAEQENVRLQRELEYYQNREAENEEA